MPSAAQFALSIARLLERSNNKDVSVRVATMRVDAMTCLKGAGGMHHCADQDCCQL